MSGFYIGVDGKARKIKGGYIGIDGKARKIKKGYIGVNGVARLCFVDNPFNPVFADNTWEEIALACQTNSVPDTWAVGDQKTMTINGANYTIDIIGKNHDDYADGSGKAPLTFQLHDCYGTKYPMYSSYTSPVSWTSSTMRKSYLATILSKLPLEVQTTIREVNKLTSIGGTSSTITTTADKLFLLSEVEIFNTYAKSKYGEGVQYEYYKNGGSKLKKVNGVSTDWWERSPWGTEESGFCYVKSGNSDATVCSNSHGVSFAFCF